MADSRGRVFGSIPGIANRARISVESARIAMSTFLSPDPDSRTPVAEGRRIETIDGGWRLINHEKYREIRDHESIKEAKRRYINKRREEERKAKGVDQGVDNVDHSRSDVDRCRHNAEAEAEADKTKEKTTSLSPSAQPTKKNTTLEGFVSFWSAYPKKIGKGAAETAWKKAKVNGHLSEVLSALDSQKRSDQWTRDNGQYIPNPATWINQRRWEDDPTVAVSAPVVDLSIFKD
jgi:hypothetical protein